MRKHVEDGVVLSYSCKSILFKTLRADTLGAVRIRRLAPQARAVRIRWLQL